MSYLGPNAKQLLSSMRVSAGRIVSSAPVIHKPSSVPNWSSLPPGWIPLSPMEATTGLTRATNITYAAGGATLHCGGLSDYFYPYDGGHGTPPGFICYIDPRVDALSLSLTVDTFAFHGLIGGGADQYGAVGIDVLTLPHMVAGGTCNARIWYKKAGTPYYYARMDARPPGRTTSLTSTETLISSSSADPGEQTIRLDLSERLRVMRGYINGTEIGGGSIPTGGYDWTRPTRQTWGSIGPGPLAILISAGINAAPAGTPLPSVRVTDLTVS